MTRLRLAAYRELSQIAESAGYHWVRCVASHNTFRSAEGRIVVIPDHGSRPTVRLLLRKILRDLGLSVDEYHRLLDSL